VENCRVSTGARVVAAAGRYSSSAVRYRSRRSIPDVRSSRASIRAKSLSSKLDPRSPEGRPARAL